MMTNMLMQMLLLPVLLALYLRKVRPLTWPLTAWEKTVPTRARPQRWTKNSTLP